MSNNNNLSNNLVLVALVVLAIFIAVKVLPFFFRLAWNIGGLVIVAGVIYIAINERARHIFFGMVRELFNRYTKK